MYQFYVFIGQVFFILFFAGSASFLLVRLFIGIKYDRMFRHVRPPNDYGFLSSFARSTAYSMMIIGQNSPLFLGRKQFTKVYGGYSFAEHASRIDFILSYFFWWCSGLMFLVGMILLALHLFYHFNYNALAQFE